MELPEEWRSVEGFPDHYKVSNLGRVRSSARQNPTYLVGKISRNGRRIVLLYDHEKRRHYRTVYTLVLEAFVGPRPPGHQACHWDGNSLNDRLDNLRWDTPKNNAADKYRHGTMHGARPGEEHHEAKLSEDDVRAIRAEPKFWGVNTMLARSFGVSPAQIGDIRSGKYWRHVI